MRMTPGLWPMSRETGGDGGGDVDQRIQHGLPRSLEGPPASTCLLDASGEFLHEVVHRPVLSDQPRDLVLGVDHGRMIASAELLADSG